MSSVFLVIVFILMALLLLPAFLPEGFVSRPGVLGNIMRQRLTETPYPGFFDHYPHYNYSYLLGNPYGYYYRYPFYEEGARCRFFPYVHSYTTGQLLKNCAFGKN